jgi:copper chaperone CopZ
MIRWALLLVGLFALLVYGIGCATAGHNAVKEGSGESEIRIYQVFGMDCPGCHGALEKLVKPILAVQEAEANWKEQRLVVTVRPGAQLNDEDIYDAIQRANFTPGERIK